MAEDMEEEILAELLDYLNDPNGGDPPLPKNAQRRFELQAKMMKILYANVREQGKLMREMHDVVIQSPPMALWIRNHMGRAFSIGVSLLLLMVGLWFGLASVDAQLDISNLDTSIAFGVLGLAIGGLGLLFKAT